MSQFLRWSPSIRSTRACYEYAPQPYKILKSFRERGSRENSKRFNSNRSQQSPPRHRSYLYGVLGGGTLIATYLFWPSPSRAAPTKADALLSPAHFTPVTVAASEPCVDPDTKLITLAVPSESLSSLEESAFSPIWSIYVKDDDIQVERAYTPLEGIDSQGRMKFWIKKYAHGEVGRWLHSKRPGDIIEIRGPLKTWPWRDNNWDEIIMVRTNMTGFLIQRSSASQLLLDFRRDGNNTILSITSPCNTLGIITPIQNTLYSYSLFTHTYKSSSAFHARAFAIGRKVKRGPLQTDASRRFS